MKPDMVSGNYCIKKGKKIFPGSGFLSKFFAWEWCIFVNIPMFLNNTNLRWLILTKINNQPEILEPESKLKIESIRS